LYQICNTFNKKKQTGKISESDEVIYSEHLKRKEESRIEKENDKKKAKHDKDILWLPLIYRHYYKRRVLKFHKHTLKEN
jgi:hypothetical protein